MPLHLSTAVPLQLILCFCFQVLREMQLISGFHDHSGPISLLQASPFEVCCSLKYRFLQYPLRQHKCRGIGGLEPLPFSDSYHTSCHKWTPPPPLTHTPTHNTQTPIHIKTHPHTLQVISDFVVSTAKRDPEGRNQQKHNNCTTFEWFYGHYCISCNILLE